MAKLDEKKLLKELSDKWQGRTCPMCIQGNWIVSENIFELREFKEGNLVIGGTPIQPVIPVTCDNCGNTILVNPIILDCIEKE